MGLGVVCQSAGTVLAVLAAILWIGAGIHLAPRPPPVRALADGDPPPDGALPPPTTMASAPPAARRVASRALRAGAAPVAVPPDMTVDALGEAVFVGYFPVMFYLSQRPWRAQDPRAKSSIGIGAFNLVRRTAYERAGGHARIRFELIDDLAIGKILKQTGARQMLALDGGRIRAKWHVGVRGLIRG